MSGNGTIVTLSPRDYDAVLFDLDGVLTRTADVHAAAWQRLFDDFLKQRAAERGEAFVPFDIEADYRRYIDGKPRYDGVRSFLESRGITLPPGEPDDQAGERTMHALGDLKDRYFNESLREQGVTVYAPAVTLVQTLRNEGVATAVVSSSVNCEAVLEAAGIAALFDAMVDGTDVRRLRLAGKPSPDAFLEGARRLRVQPGRTAVVEDAIAGVAAGHAGGFALVIGIDRVGQSQALREAGAHVVVSNLAQVQVASEPPSAWSLVYDAYDAERERTRESLCALGNGYFETRGAAPWARADDQHYPGTYVGGVYNRLSTEIAGRTVENEDLVNVPNWLVLTFRLHGGDWFDERAVTLLSCSQELDLKRGMLLRSLRFEDAAGRRSTLAERRCVSMADMHLAALELTLTPENWSGSIEVRTALDGTVVNAGAALYRPFNNRHLEPLCGTIEGDELFLLVRTSQSRIDIAQAARTRVLRGGSADSAPRRAVEQPAYVAQEIMLDAREGEPLVFEKTLALYTSRDQAIAECGLAARKALDRAPALDELVARHQLAWRQLWRRFDVHLRAAEPRFTLNVPMLLRLNMFHLLQSASQNSIGLDIGVPARGWTGEAYLGHIFWDELYIFPTLNFRTPEITRSLLMYRYRRLEEARAAARAAGLAGAMFPWQSGSDGQEETQDLNLNYRSMRWMPDNSYLQRHVGSAIAWNVWQYFQVTCDHEFLQFYGAELVLEIARFWSSLASFDVGKKRYVIRGVMGPDEFHDAYPGSSTPGLDNNAYTNVMAVWVLCRALEVLELLPPDRSSELTRRLGLTQDEIERWDDISRRMFVPFLDGGILGQFEGYEALEELDWEAYRVRYGNIQRLDLILEAENDSPNRYKAGKQPDVLMLFYVLSAEELAALLARLGYEYDTTAIPATIEYYDARSSHGSTLSRVVHAWVLARSDRPRAMRYFAEALQSDVSDIQQGTTAEGVHLGAMAGTVDLVQRVSTGIEATGGVLRLNPRLPVELERLDLRIRYRSHTLDLRVTHDLLTVRSWPMTAAPIRIAIGDDTLELATGETRQFVLAAA